MTNRPAWPLVAGHRIRGAQTVQALAGLGELDIVMPLPDVYDEPIPPGVDIRSFKTVPVRRRSAGATVARWAVSRRGITAVRIEWGDATDTVSAMLRAGDYDVVWLTPGNGWSALRNGASLAPYRARLVVDLDDLEDQKLALAIANTQASIRRPGQLLSLAQQRVDLGRWRRVQDEILTRSDAVVVCSDLDVERLGRDHVFAVPNSYPDPGQPRTETERIVDPPYVLFVGDLAYAPNAEGAVWLVDEVMPRVWRSEPSLQLHLVGGGPEALTRQLSRDTRVVIRGRVPHIDAEVRGATATLAPLLWGGGTRLKVLEGLAHGVPVVSTPIGAEGLGLRPGEHGSIEASPDGFASGVVTFARSAERRAAVADTGRRHFEGRFTQQAVERSMAQILHRVLSAPGHQRDGNVRSVQ